MSLLRTWISTRLANYLGHETQSAGISPPPRESELRACLRPGDVLLVEGRTRMSVAIKYLTQSTWSHAALYVGPEALTGLAPQDAPGEMPSFVEADVVHGVRAVGFDTYAGLHCRVCRAASLSDNDRARLVDHAVSRIGHQYDLRNVFDLGRYLWPMPPVPARWRRRMLALGSGDPTRAICSTLIAQAFQAVRYPILPLVEMIDAADPGCADCEREILHVRHHSLYVPRDFDVSPYFEIIKPTLARGFDHHRLSWHEATGDALAA